jgi:hypothetical protein
MPWTESVTFLDRAVDYGLMTQQFAASVTGLDCGISFVGATLDDVTMNRLVGCAAMVYMPADGVPEAVELLHGCWKFYTEHRSTEIAEKAQPLISGTVVSTGTRPALTFSE